jgi:ubiquinone/menaquinone biosynthesis C-methylase UbiE
VRVDYDRVSEHYDRSRRFGARFTRELLAGLPAGFSPERVLDVGCGTGNATLCLVAAFPGAGVLGLDLSRGMLERAREKLEGVELVRADAARLPLAPASFDLVLGAYVLHHLDDPAGFYAGVGEVLRPGGRLVLLTAGHEQIRAHFLIRFFPRFGEIDCRRFPALAEVEPGLRSAGLTDVARREIPVAEYAVDEQYLRRVAAKHISTFELMAEAEFREGLKSLTAWVRERREAGGEMPRHTARGTLLVAAKPNT